jgi:3-deoxy-D-manno-octulosonic-acid transferase
MAMSNQPKGINAFTIGNINPYLVDALSKDGIKRYQFIRKFYTHSTNHHDKVKLTFNEYPEEAGNYGIYNQKNVQNISFNYDRTESDLSAIDENALSK